MNKLSEPQLTLLIAADAGDGALANQGHPKTVAALIREGFLISVPQTGGPSRLLITAAGREAITQPGSDAAGLEAASGNAAADSAETAGVFVRAPRPRLPGIEEGREETRGPAPPRKGKIVGLVEMLRQPGGTTVEAMMVATGWQAHSVRGAMSGAIKKGLGLAIVSEKTETGRIYRLEPVAGA
jgi:Protein of unknown function (DUF3489)